MKRGRSFWMAGWLLMAGTFVTSPLVVQADDRSPLAELFRVDLLPRFRSAVKVGSISSYDRTGGNDDGFSGKYSFIRKEGDGLVIADLQGPGVITRIWTPTPTDDPVEFFFDGEETPRIRVKFIEIFDGSKEPFVSPLAGFGSGGFYSYVPLSYRKSCKVVVRAKRVQFYQINFATYSADAHITTYSDAGELLRSQTVSDAGKLLQMAGGDVSSSVAGAEAIRTSAAFVKLVPGKSSLVYESKQGGRIVGLRFSPASALGGKERAILLRVTWDGDKEPAVLCPAGDFFGYSWGDPSARSLLVGANGDTAYCYFPMPFERSARIELVDERTSGPPIDVHAEVLTTNRKRQPDEGRFYAVWRRENPTTIGKPFTYVETQGRGHLVGVTLQAQGHESGNTYFFEGDDQCYIDGELAAHGTGSEDFFNGGWYDVPGRWEQRASYPLSGCLDYKKALGRTGGYRLFLPDAYAFGKELKLHMEHSGEQNNIVTDYVGVSYLYMEKPPTTPVTVPPLAARKVVDFDRLVYVPGWNVPLHAFSFQNATLQKKEEKIAGQNARYFSISANGSDVFGPHYVSFLIEAPVAGKYRVSIDAVEGPGQAIVQLFRNEHAVGSAADLYAPERRRGNARDLGTLDMQEGDNQVMIKLTGKNSASSGLGMDLVTLIFERVH